MDRYEMSGESMNTLKSKLEEVKTSVDNSHTQLANLLSQIEGDGLWSGETMNIFMCYMKLLEQYQKSFTDAGGKSPITEAISALSSNETRVDNFYNLQEYLDLETIS